MKVLRAVAAGMLLCFGVVHVSQAVPVNWPSSIVHIAVEKKELKDVLRDFAASQGIAVQISPGVTGVVSGRFDVPPQQFFDSLAASFGFVWFYDGAVLSISNANEMTRQVITLTHASTKRLAGELRHMALADSRFPISYAADEHTVIVTGPPSYVRLVSNVAKQLDGNFGALTGSMARIFKLKNAWAADHKVQIEGETVTVPGVASVLSNLFANNTKPWRAPPDTNGPTMRRIPPMLDASGSTGGGGLQSLIPPIPDSQGGTLGGMFGRKLPPLMGDTGDSSGQQSGSGEDLSTDSSLPVIQADPMTNSVLIRDTPDRIDGYGPLIEKLDVRPKVIEIEAHIIDIQDDALKQIGVDWRAHNSHIDIQTGNGITAQNTFNGNLNPVFGQTTIGGDTLSGSTIASLFPGTSIAGTLVSATPAGASISAVLGDAGRYLLARVSALEQTSEARVDATPKVATLDNVEAVMNSKTRFYVRVAGYTAADLFNIGFGTSLRVLPLVIVDDNGQTRIKLNVHIEDGQLVSGQNVDNIPIVTTTEINTQALVKENESLLIGGYSVTNKTNLVSGVSGLSKIPIIGALFRYHNNEDSHMERLFLITPRILPL